MNKYTITVTESASGDLKVTEVQKLVKINQHRTDFRRMPPNAFAFAASLNTRSSAKRAARRSR